MLRSRPQSHQRTLAVLAAGCAVYALLQSLMVPALATLRDHLHTSQNTVTWVVTSYLLAASIFTPIMGRIGDMVGKRRVLIGSLLCLVVGSLLAAVATSITLMLVGRVIQGVGGGLLPLSFGIIRDEFPPEKVAGAIGALSALLGIGSGLGLVLSGPITEGLGYTWLFWLPMIVAGATTIAAVFWVRESPVRLPGRIGWRAPVLLSSWLVALLLGVSKAPEWGWLSTKVLMLIAVAAVLAVLWVIVELGSENPLIDMRMMRIPAVWTSNLIILLLGFGMYASFAFIPQFVQTPPVHGYGFGATVTQSGLVMLPQALAMFMVGVVAGRLARRFVAKRLLLAGCLITTVPFVTLVLANDHVWQILVAMTLIGVGSGLVLSIIPGVIVTSVPAEQTGAATGMNANIRTIGGAIGAAAMSTIVTSSAGVDGIPTESGYAWGFVMIGVATLIAALACLLVPRSSRSDEPEPETQGTPLEYAELALTPATPAAQIAVSRD